MIRNFCSIFVKSNGSFTVFFFAFILGIQFILLAYKNVSFLVKFIWYLLPIHLWHLWRQNHIYGLRIFTTIIWWCKNFLLVDQSHLVDLVHKRRIWAYWLVPPEQGVSLQIRGIGLKLSILQILILLCVEKLNFASHDFNYDGTKVNIVQ